MANIVVAKRELYHSLKDISNDVTGASIKAQNGNQHIVIFLSHPSPKLTNRIPKEFKGNKVQIEIRTETKVW